MAPGRAAARAAGRAAGQGSVIAVPPPQRAPDRGQGAPGSRAASTPGRDWLAARPGRSCRACRVAPHRRRCHSFLPAGPARESWSRRLGRLLARAGEPVEEEDRRLLARAGGSWSRRPGGWSRRRRGSVGAVVGAAWPASSSALGRAAGASDFIGVTPGTVQPWAARRPGHRRRVCWSAGSERAAGRCARSGGPGPMQARHGRAGGGPGQVLGQGQGQARDAPGARLGSTETPSPDARTSGCMAARRWLRRPTGAWTRVGRRAALSGRAGKPVQAWAAPGTSPGVGAAAVGRSGGGPALARLCEVGSPVPTVPGGSSVSTEHACGSAGTPRGRAATTPRRPGGGSPAGSRRRNGGPAFAARRTDGGRVTVWRLTDCGESPPREPSAWAFVRVKGVRRRALAAADRRPGGILGSVGGWGHRADISVELLTFV